MDLLTARAIAQELMDIQMGSAEDAKNLLDNTLTNHDRRLISDQIDIIAEEHDHYVEKPEFPTYFDTQGREHQEF